MAVAHHREALAIFETLGDQQELANTLDLLAFSNLIGGDLKASIRNYDRAIALFRKLDDRTRLASSLIGHASTVLSMVWLTLVPTTLPPDAAHDLQEALRIAGETASVPVQIWAYYSLGVLHMVRGHIGRAFEDIQTSLGFASEIGHRFYLVTARFFLGVLFTELLAPDEAREQFESALALARELRSPTWIQAILGALAGVYLLLEDQKSAQSCLESAISSQTSMDTVGKRYCWVRQAELALAQGDPVLALDITERLIASAPGMSPGQVITFLWKLKGEALATTGRIEDALPLLHAAIENAKAAGERFLLWRVHACLGRLYHNIGDHQATDEEIASARAVIDELAATIPDEALKDSFRQGAYNTLRT